MKIISFFLFTFILILLSITDMPCFSQTKEQDNALLTTIKSFSGTSAVSGREEEAASFIESLFDKGTLKKDHLGNLILTLGSGYPKRLFAVPLDEPGYAVTRIRDDGYLRIAPVGMWWRSSGTMSSQFLEGNDIIINTATGPQYGVVSVPSLHFEPARTVPVPAKKVFQWNEVFIDAGDSSAEEVGGQGIHLLDPVTIFKQPLILNQSICAPAAKEKSAAVALAVVARTLMHAKFKGTVVIAWTCLDLLSGKGLADVIQKYGPFDDIVSYNRNQDEVNKIKKEIPPPSNPFEKVMQLHLAPGTMMYDVGLPSRFTFTPVEMVAESSVDSLIQTWLGTIENKQWATSSLPLGNFFKRKKRFKGFENKATILSKLISLYGVSTQEKPVHDYILSVLPKWAKPVTDSIGNTILTFGQGKQHLVFVAHTDEVGFVVDSIRNDGALIVKEKGGSYKWLWEGHPALIHVRSKEIPGIFEPRENYLYATKRDSGQTLIVYAGFATREQALKAGINEGLTTITMPKQMIRLSDERATGRSMDDRVGCASLLLALQNIRPEQLPFKVTFIWSVQEELGLVGAAYAAKGFQDAAMVYPVDTYVTSDAPGESHLLGYGILGDGAEVRALEYINFVDRNHLNYLLDLAAKNNIKLKYGFGAGSTDGQEFLRYDIPSVCLSWPLRYSHSPAEVIDFRDMENLVKLIRAIMLDKTKVY